MQDCPRIFSYIYGVVEVVVAPMGGLEFFSFSICPYVHEVCMDYSESERGRTMVRTEAFET